MLYLPHERLVIKWSSDHTSFHLSLPWVSMDIDVEASEKAWIEEGIENLHTHPKNPSSQRFLHELKAYPIFYLKPRTREEFEGLDLQEGLSSDLIDVLTPGRLVETVGIDLPDRLKGNVLPQWTWDWDKILSKAKIEDTDLYDPVSFITYLICYRLEWENTTWSGQNGLGQLLETYLKEDEHKFFWAMGWISRQSWYVTMESGRAMSRALETFPKAADLLDHFIKDEAGHYKFMEQVFDDLELNKEDFTVGPGTVWLLSCHARMADVSLMAFSAMINLFEAAFYEGEDPLSRVIRKSSKPYAARGYDLHYKINQEHRHCDMPVVLAKRLAPQTREQLEITLGIFELTLHFLDTMEQELEQYLQYAEAA